MIKLSIAENFFTLIGEGLTDAMNPKLKQYYRANADEIDLPKVKIGGKTIDRNHLKHN